MRTQKSRIARFINAVRSAHIALTKSSPSESSVLPGLTVMSHVRPTFATPISAAQMSSKRRSVPLLQHQRKVTTSRPSSQTIQKTVSAAPNTRNYHANAVPKKRPTVQRSQIQNAINARSSEPSLFSRVWNAVAHVRRNASRSFAQLSRLLFVGHARWLLKQLTTVDVRTLSVNHFQHQFAVHARNSSAMVLTR